MRRKREVLVISSIRTTMVFSYSKVLPNPWEKTASATIIISLLHSFYVADMKILNMIFLLMHRSSPSKYSLRFLILPEVVIIPKDSKGNLQERPHSYLYKQKRWKLHIKTDKQHPKKIPSKSSRDINRADEFS